MIPWSIVVSAPDDVRGIVVGVKRSFCALGREASGAALRTPAGVDWSRDRARVRGRSRDVAVESCLQKRRVRGEPRRVGAEGRLTMYCEGDVISRERKKRQDEATYEVGGAIIS